jgi:hypothetical protein
VWGGATGLPNWELGVHGPRFYTVYRGRTGTPTSELYDEIWIVPGASDPLVLRPRGDSNHFRLIGRAYLRGFDLGDVLQNERLNWQDVILEYSVRWLAGRGFRPKPASARLGLARLRWVWRAPVWVWRRQFRQGALASSRRCFSTSVYENPSSSPFTLLATLSHLLPSRPNLSSLSAAFPALAPGLPLLSLCLRLTSLLPPSLPY